MREWEAYEADCERAETPEVEETCAKHGESFGPSGFCAGCFIEERAALAKVFCARCGDYMRLGDPRERDICDKHATEPAWED